MVVLGRVREGPTRPGHGLWLSRRRRPVLPRRGQPSLHLCGSPPRGHQGSGRVGLGPGMGRVVSPDPLAAGLGCVLECKRASAGSIMLAACKTLASKRSAACRLRPRRIPAAYWCVLGSLRHGAWPWQAARRARRRVRSRKPRVGLAAFGGAARPHPIPGSVKRDEHAAAQQWHAA